MYYTQKKDLEVPFSCINGVAEFFYQRYPQEQSMNHFNYLFAENIQESKKKKLNLFVVECG